MNFSHNLNSYPLIAFDTETSGAYPVGYDVVEFGAIKYLEGKEIDRMQLLFKPREKMSDFIIGIHGIKNEDVADKQPISESIARIYDFFKDSILMAHHAPFDMGFMAYEFEKAGLPWLETPVVCTSLLSRKVIPESGNHKLQTLVKFLKIDGGAAHRAFDDAKSCLNVGLECFKRLDEFATSGDAITLSDVIQAQGKLIKWEDYALITSNKSILTDLVKAILQKTNVDFAYEGGSSKGKIRTVKPIGIVRNPDGDYLMGFCLKDKANKRYYLDKISDLIC